MSVFVFSITALPCPCAWCAFFRSATVCVYKSSLFSTDVSIHFFDVLSS